MKYIVYYRVSTKGQGESGLGLEAQQSMIKHFLSDEDIAGTYTEVISAKTLPSDRPELGKAIKEAESKGYGLAVAKVDRLSRVTEHALEVFAKLDGFLYACDIPMQKGARMDKFTLTIYMAIADRERELIGIRTKAALKAKKAQGATLGKPENLTASAQKKGVEAIKAKARKNENNKRATDYARMLRSSGNTLQSVADTLNGQGFKTSRGKEFNPVQVKRLIERVA